LPICLYVVMGSSRMFVARYLLPCLPVLIVLAAVVLSDLARRSVLAAVVVATLVVGGTLPDSLRFDTLLTRTDTRTAARAWVQANLQAGARVAADPPSNGPPLDKLPLDLVSPMGGALYDQSLDDYRRQGVQYLITSSYSADAPNLDAARDAHRREFFAALRREAQQVAEFLPYHGAEPDFVYDRVYGPYDALAAFDLPGPTIRVFRLSAPSATPGG
jgi:hypothetical protein